MKLKNILVAIDFIEPTDKLIAYAITLSKIERAKIYLLHVDNSDLSIALDSGYQFTEFSALEVNPFISRDEKAVKLKLEHKKIGRYIEDLKAKGIEASGYIIEGSVEDAIIDKSKTLEIDTIIIGHQKHNALYSLFFGDTSSKIIHQTDVPVLVVPYK